MGIATLLKRHGRNLTLEKKGTPIYNPSTGTATNNSQNYTIRGYFYDSRNLAEYATQIEEGNRRVILYPTDTAGLAYPKPEIDDRIVGQRDEVSIWRVEEIMSNEKVLFYICRVKE